MMSLTDGLNDAQRPSTVPQYLMMPVWEYLEHESTDEWRPVAEGSMGRIEAAYQSGRSTCTVTSCAYSYDVDLRGLVQTNTKTGTRRKIRRRVIVDSEAAQKVLEQIGSSEAEYQDLQWQLENLEQLYELALDETSQQDAAHQRLQKEQDNLEIRCQALEWQLENLEQLYALALQELAESPCPSVGLWQKCREQINQGNLMQMLVACMWTWMTRWMSPIVGLWKKRREQVNQRNLTQMLVACMWTWMTRWMCPNVGLEKKCKEQVKQGNLLQTLVTCMWTWMTHWIGLCAGQDLQRQLANLKQLYEVALDEKSQLGAAHGDLQAEQDNLENRYQALEWQLENLEELYELVSDEQDALEKRCEDLEKKRMEQVKQKNLIMLSALPDVETLASTALCKRYFEQSVPSDSPKCHALREMFEASMTSHRQGLGSDVWCEPPAAEITAIYEIVNPTMLAKYKTARQEVRERSWDGCTPLQGIAAMKCGVEDGHVELNEYLLFHGCSWEAAKKIKEQGFDAQRGAEGGAMFGYGTYFAQNASKSDGYTCQDFSTSERCMLVARVLLGESMIVTTSPFHHGKPKSRAPERENGQPYDSISAQTRAQGGRVDHMEFVIFKDQMALPQYVIHYRHKCGCKCHTCCR